MEAPKFNAEMLALAREAKGLTQKALADTLQVTQPHLSKVESGMANPSEDFLARAANALDCAVPFFYRWPRAWVPPVVLYRKQQSVGALVLKKINAQIRRQRIEFERLLRSVEIDDAKVPAISLSSSPEWTPTRAAKELRAQWQMPRGPIGNVTDLLESKGVIIVPMDFDTAKLDGISAPACDGLPPMIFINARIPGDRQRWTLCHELGHLVLHHHLAGEFPPGEVEDEANEFGSEFLMPSDDIAGHLSRLSIRDAASLKVRWGVSIASLIFRAAQLEQISESKKTTLYIELSKMGWRKREGVEVAAEQPALYLDVLRTHIDELKYTPTELAALIDVPESVITARLNEPKRGLRLIQ